MENCGKMDVVVFLWWCFCGGGMGCVFVLVFLWWCGGVFVVMWWCFCGGGMGGVFVLVFLWWCGGVFVVMWWCFCGGGMGGVFVLVFLLVVVFLWWCGCVFVVVFLYVFFWGQGPTFLALPRSYAKSVDNTGVKRCLVSKFSLHCSYPHSHQTFPLFNCLHCFRDIRRLVLVSLSFPSFDSRMQPSWYVPSQQSCFFLLLTLSLMPVSFSSPWYS